MAYENGQFGTFDGRDNRKHVMEMFRRFNYGVTEDVARSKRAGFLQGLVNLSENGFAGKKTRVLPCSAAEAYHLFVAVTGVLGVGIEEAAVRLEDAMRIMKIPMPHNMAVRP